VSARVDAVVNLIEGKKSGIKLQSGKKKKSGKGPQPPSGSGRGRMARGSSVKGPSPPRARQKLEIFTNALIRRFFKNECFFGCYGCGLGMNDHFGLACNDTPKTDLRHGILNFGWCAAAVGPLATARPSH